MNMVTNVDLRPFLTTFILDRVLMSVFGIKLLMLVIMKAILSLYNIGPLSIHKAWNTKELCVFENAASSRPFCFLYSKPFFLQ